MEKINNFAPVLIPTLNRYVHFKRCVESLSRCTYADQTELYIALDYPLNETHWEGYNKICDYIKEIKGFKDVIITKRDNNFGVRDNTRDVRKTIFEKYDRMIMSEDDNEFSPNFLAFVNWGLEKYKDDDRIFAVCGYNYPIDMSGYDKEYYFANEYSAWGCGIWKKKWEYVQTNIFTNEYLQSIFNSFSKLRMILSKRIEILLGLKKCKDENIILGDTVITSYLYLNNLFSVFPKISKVRNWGHDGSGINCGTMTDNNIFNRQEIDNNTDFISNTDIQVQVDKYTHAKLRKYFIIPFRTKVKIIIKLIFNL